MAIQKFRGKNGNVWVNSETVTFIEDDADTINKSRVQFTDGTSLYVDHQPAHVARKLNKVEKEDS